MTTRIPPTTQVEIAFNMLTNALRYGANVISKEEAEKWLAVLHTYAKAGAALNLPTADNKKASHGDQANVVDLH